MTDPPASGGTPDRTRKGPPPATSVSVVVVNYEAGSHLLRCLAALRAEGPRELVVVDNGSSDGSMAPVRAGIPEAIVVEPGANLGYGSAANRGVRLTTAPYVFVANADLEVGPGTLATLAAVLDRDPGCAVVGPLLRTSDGDRYPSARRFPSLPDAAGHAVLGIVAPNNRFTRAYQRSDLDAPGTAVRYVDWVSGACFLARRAAFDDVDGFDEAYFMYSEDVDLCWRLHRRGWRVAYAPAAEVVHAQGVSTDRHPYRMIVEHHRSLWRFARRSQQGWRRLLLPLVALGLGVRVLLAWADRRFGRHRGASRAQEATL